LSNRITSVQVENLAEAAMELLSESGQRAMSMHEVANQAWSSPEMVLPEFITAPALDANLRVRKALEERGMTMVPITASYPRKIRGKVFGELEVMGCLPRKGWAQWGLLFIDGESSLRDREVWNTWVHRGRSSAEMKLENVRIGVLNAETRGVITPVAAQLMLALERAGSDDDESDGPHVEAGGRPEELAAS
jgi:hypothetical protein